MKEFSVPMALVDFVPVILFTIAAIMLQRDLYNKMSKGAFALFAAGTINIAIAGFCKALYKLLYSAGICDFEYLSNMFFPVQSIGFLLAGIGMIAMVFRKQTEKGALCVAPPFFSGTMLFVAAMVIGLALLCTALSVIAIRMKRPFIVVFFALSFMCSLIMGYLSTRDFSLSYMNWIGETINIAGQGLFLFGVILLRKK